MEDRRIRVFYDYDAFYRDHKFGGIARCFIELMKHLKCDYFLSVKYSLVYYIKEVLPDVDDFMAKSFRGKARIRKFLNQIYNIRNLIIQHYDIVHITGESLSEMRFIHKPIVVTMHDCVLEKIFQNGKRSDRRLKLMQKASHVVAVSENTKNDLLYYYPEISPQKITVIYHGFSEFAKSVGFNQWGRYFLYVGMRQSYKNFKRLVEAMKIVKASNPEIKLICAGKPFDNSEIKLISDNSLIDNISSVQCDDSILADLYKYASAFVYPSLYEGFGIPILEAWSFDCPVVLSNTSCFPEVAGDAGLYFNPENIQDISDKLISILHSADIRQQLITNGRKRLTLFSWEQSAMKHEIIYKNLLKK